MCSRSARTPAWATFTSVCFRASSARRQSATLSSSETSKGSRSHRRAKRAGARLERRERAAVPRARCSGKGGGAERGVSRALGAQSAVAGEAPGAVDEDADTDPLRLGVGERVDAAVPGADRLRAAHDRPRVGVRRPGPERCIDGCCSCPLTASAYTDARHYVARPGLRPSVAGLPGDASHVRRMRWRGLEPPRPNGSQGPQPCASTNSATSARAPV